MPQVGVKPSPNSILMWMSLELILLFRAFLGGRYDTP